MRLVSVGLQPFGRFSDVELALDSDAGMHIIYGSNGAGKSTLLDAIRYGLYGMPIGKAKDPNYDFLFKPRQLRVSLALELDDGAQLAFKRSRAKLSVLDPETDQHSPELESQLTRTLFGVPKDVWMGKHGLSQRSMREGAHAMLSSAASEESIFAAATGVTSVSSVLKALQDARRELLSDSGGTGRIHKLVADLKTARSQLAAAQRRSVGYDDIYKNHDRLEQQIGESSERRLLLEQDQARYVAVANIVGQLIARQELCALRDAANAPSAGWGDAEHNQLVAAREAIVRLDGEMSAQATRIKSVQDQIVAVEFNPQLVDALPELDRLFERLERYLSARDSLPELAATTSNLSHELRTGLAQLGYPSTDAVNMELVVQATSVLPSPRARAGLAESVAQTKDLHANLDVATQELRSAREQVKLVQEQVDRSLTDQEARSWSALATTLGAAKRVDLSALDRLVAKVNSADRAQERRAQQLLGGARGLEDVLGLSLPPDETVAEFEMRFGALATQIAEQDQAIAQAKSHIASREEQIAELTQGMAVPDPAEVVVRRQDRDDLFEPIARAVELGEPLSDPGDTINAYRESVLGADTLADEIAQDAVRVGQMEAKRSELEADHIRVETAQAKALELSGQLESVQAEWELLWSPLGLEARSAKVMRSLMGECAEIRRRHDDVENDRIEIEMRELEVVRLGQQLATEMARLQPLPDGVASQRDQIAPADLAALIEQAEQRVQELDARDRQLATVKGQYEAAQEDVSRRERAVKRIREQIESVQRQQGDLFQAVGLAPTASVEQAESWLEAVGRSQELVDELSGLVAAHSQAATLVQAYEAELESLVGALQDARSVSQSGSVELTVRKLRAQSAEAVRGQSQRDQLERQLSDYRVQLEELQANRASADSAISALQQRVGVARVTELEQVDADWSVYSDLSEQITQLDQQIVSATSMSIEDVLTLWSGQNEVQLKAHSESISEKLVALEEAVAGMNEERKALAKQMGALDESHEQSEALAQIADCQAGLETSLGQYRSLIIQEQILIALRDEQAKRSVGPVVAQTGRFLSRMTRGRWVDLVLELGEGVHPEIKAKRGITHPDEDDLVSLSGLSEGTLDQLYLALRLAILVDEANRTESMPLVLDDILMSFDDDRARATLELLAEVSTSFQIVFLTHHRHLLELAAQTPNADQIRVHELPNTAS